MAAGCQLSTVDGQQQRVPSLNSRFAALSQALYSKECLSPLTNVKNDALYFTSYPMPRTMDGLGKVLGNDGTVHVLARVLQENNAVFRVMTSK